MKLRNFFFAALAAVFAFASCEPADPNTGTNNSNNSDNNDGEGTVLQSAFTGAGDYWIVADDVVATPKAAETTYGYLDVISVWKKSDVYASAEDNKFTFAEVEGGYTIQDSHGRYLHMTGNYNSFNYAAELPTEGHVWTVASNDDGTYDITNVLKSKYVQYSTQYESFGAYDSAQNGGVLPKLVSVVNPISLVASLDVNSLAFSSEGETKTVTATEGVSVTAQSDNSAFTVAVDANVVSVTVSETTEAREGLLTVTMTCEGFSVVKTVGLSQAAPSTGNEKTVTVTLGSGQNWIAATHADHGAGYKLETDDFVIEHYKATSSNDVVTTYAETRIYVGHVFMVTPKNGGQIKSVKLTTAGGKNGPLEIGGTEYTAVDSVLEWTGAVRVFMAKGKTQARVTQMEVVYE